MRALPVFIAAALALTGCAGTKVALLDGEETCYDTATQKNVQCPTGSVAVLNDETGGDVAVLDKANSRSRTSATRASIKNVDPEQLKKRYGKLFETLPEAPRLFVFYFASGSNSIPEEAKPLLADMFAEIARRPGVDVNIVGHSDRVGELTSNDKLSLDRAEGVKAQLIALGLDANISTTAGRGERQPIDNPDQDEFESNQNRRVEVFVK